MQAPSSIILLKDGTDTSKGRAQIISNINAVEVVCEIVKSTLGPCGMDKMIVGDRHTSITNDGATILRTLDIVHPAAQTLVKIAKSQDFEVGDGTTSVVVLAGEILSGCKKFIEEGTHPRIIVKAINQACAMAKSRILELAIETKEENTRDTLIKCAITSLNSKLVNSHSQFFAEMVVDACLKLDGELDLDLVAMKKEPGGGMEDSIFVEGVAFKKTFSYAGFEQQPKLLKDPKIILLNVELELKSEGTNMKVKVEDPDDYKRFVDAEWKIIFDKLDNIINTGANVVLSRLPIGDLATQYFADRDIFCAGRVPEDDLARVAKATGGKIQTTCSNLTEDILGTCGVFEEKQIGKERYNLFTECKDTKTATIILRGGGKQFIDEAERSIHDAIMVVRRAMKHTSTVGGAGSLEMELSSYLMERASAIPGKTQPIIKAFAKAFEAIPWQLAKNANLDPIEVLALLRQAHVEHGKTWAGVDVVNGGILDAVENFIWEPTLVRLNAIQAATEAATIVLLIDLKVKNPRATGRFDPNQI